MRCVCQLLKDKSGGEPNEDGDKENENEEIVVMKKLTTFDPVKGGLADFFFHFFI